MKSVADQLRAETVAEMLAMTPEERVALSFRLGDEAIADLARNRGISEEKAAWLIRAQRRAGVTRDASRSSKVSLLSDGALIES